MQRLRRNAAYCLALHGLISLGGTTHIEPGPIPYQSPVKKMPSRLVYRASDRGISSTEVPSSQMAPACVKLLRKKSNQNTEFVSNGLHLEEEDTPIGPTTEQGVLGCLAPGTRKGLWEISILRVIHLHPSLIVPIWAGCLSDFCCPYLWRPSV